MTNRSKIEKISLFSDIKKLIDDSKANIAYAINSKISILYWNIGKLINNDILHNKRADYGKYIIPDLSKSLTKLYGKGWSEKQLRNCMHFQHIFPDKEIVYTVCRQLSWSHLRIIMYIENKLKRDFYIQICIHEKWSVRVFRERENSPVGLILCSGKSHDHIELMQLDKSNIRVAEYITVLPSQKILKDRLQKAIEIAHQKFNSE